MLTMQFRNLIITAENHENLLQEDIDKIMAALNQVFDKAELNLKNNPPEGITTTHPIITFVFLIRSKPVQPYKSHLRPVLSSLKFLTEQDNLL